MWNRFLGLGSRLVRGGALAATAMLMILLSASGQSFGQQAGAPGAAINPEVFPLNLTAVPDINVLGVLDKTGPGADQWAWDEITLPNKKVDLQILGKAFFWDMQVGGDGIQACATCHYHAGADHRKVNQMSPGLKAGDTMHDFIGTNAELMLEDFSPVGNVNRGLPVDEAALIAAGSVADALNGDPGSVVKADALLDVNDVVSSQGVRAGTHLGVSNNRVDTATLHAEDDANGFTHFFSANATDVPDTVRRVEPRNAPTVLNAVFNHRNFWDGRADSFFNAVNPLGFRDPSAMVKVVVAGDPPTLGEERLDLPFSALASQAVGPIGSNFEMVFEFRPLIELGRKLEGAQPLRGQFIAFDDSLLSVDRDASGRGLTGTYADRIQDIFHERFWDFDGCVDQAGGVADCEILGLVPNPAVTYTDGLGVCYDNETDLNILDCEIDGLVPNPAAYSLTAYNFALFFGLAVQAYEATLFTEDTIVDLIGGGKATGAVTNGLTGRNARSILVDGLPLEACIAGLARNNRAAEQALVEEACAGHYAKFIHPGAHSGSESNLARFPIPPGSPIGGCPDPASCDTSPNAANGIATILNVDRGLGRFFAGATGCGICHFNPEFNGATVQAITGFGAGPIGILPPGQLAREVEEPVVAERMVTFNGLPAVYDAGFYNIGVRPTPEDLALGDQIGGVPLALTKLMELLTPGFDVAGAGYDAAKIAAIQELFDAGALNIPQAPDNLVPVPWELNVACGPGLNNANANNNPNAQCIPTLIPGERLLRNGAFKAQGLRNVMFTGPYLHNGSKMNLRQVLEFYKTAGHFVNLNFNNLDAGMRIFDLGPEDEAAVIELMEIGLTDWRVAYEEGKFDHPELCIPHGHDDATGETILVGVPAVGSSGNEARLQTFEEQLAGTEGHHDFTDPCSVEGIADESPAAAIAVNGLSTIDVPPAPVP